VLERIVTLEQLQQMLAIAGPRERAYIWLCYGAGLRRNEAAFLNWPEHVDLEHGTVRIIAKGHSEREPMDVPQQACEAVRAWLDLRGDWAGPLFCRVRARMVRAGRGADAHVGPPYVADSSHKAAGGRELSFKLRELGQAIGIHGFSAHWLRHTAGTEAARAFGGNMPLVQGFLRHRNVATTSVYIHLAAAERAKTAKGVADALAAAAERAKAAEGVADAMAEIPGERQPPAQDRIVRLDDYRTG
jgi:integrase